MAGSQKLEDRRFQVGDHRVATSSPIYVMNPSFLLVQHRIDYCLHCSAVTSLYHIPSVSHAGVTVHGVGMILVSCIRSALIVIRH